MDIETIIKELEKLEIYHDQFGEGYVVDKCIDRIKEMTEGCVLVPKEWVIAASCPHAYCNGGIVVFPTGQQERCRFCDEKHTMLKANTKEESKP